MKRPYTNRLTALANLQWRLSRAVCTTLPLQDMPIASLGTPTGGYLVMLETKLCDWTESCMNADVFTEVVSLPWEEASSSVLPKLGVIDPEKKRSKMISDPGSSPTALSSPCRYTVQWGPRLELHLLFDCPGAVINLYKFSILQIK